MRGFCNGWADRHKDICNSRVAFKTKNIDMEARKFELSLSMELDIVSLFYISESNSFRRFCFDYYIWFGNRQDSLV